MYKRPMILGAGLIGGLLCKKLYRSNRFDKITVIDYDIVKNRNLSNTIYSEDHVGLKKVYSLKEIITNKYSNVNTDLCVIDSKFNENNCNVLYDADLIIDCRDFTYDRLNINCRVFISNIFLVIDSRKKISYNEHIEGSYILRLNNDEIDELITYLSNIIIDGSISEIINRREICYFSLDDDNNILSDNKQIKVKNDNFIIDNDNNSKITNLSEIGKLDMDRYENVEVQMYLSGKKVNRKKLPTKETDKRQLVELLNNSISIWDRNYYLIIVRDNNIIMIPETGAA